LDAELAGQSIAASPNGGTAGQTGVNSRPDQTPQGTAPSESGDEPPDQFAGLGPFLEDEDPVVFRAVQNLVQRQEPLAKNRYAQDEYWTQVKQGYGDYYKLEKLPDQDRWKCSVAPGASSLSLAPVPNKASDLCRKVVEALMVDPPKASPKAENDSEKAERAAEMATEFLEQDGGEAGTRDDRLFWNALDAACSKSASFLHYWVDMNGGGSVPQQIKAHPQAVDANNPLVGPDGMPTTDYILRYVTADGQFTPDASQAAPQWLPKICVDSVGREHIRTYPETSDIHDAEKVILIYYCTLGQAKRRWQTVAQLEDDELAQLCDWTPPRYIKLLPPALRARWKMASGDMADPKGSANDERVMFYYGVYVAPVPDYPKGAVVYVSGSNGGFILDKDTLTADIPDPEADDTKATRTLDIPIVQVDLMQDPDDGEPTGLPIIALVGGLSMAMTALGRGFLEAVDITLHPARYTTITSPVTEDDVNDSRATGNHIQVLSRDDYPHYEEAPVLPASFLNVMTWLDESGHSAIGNTKASTGADNQQEVSGVARGIAVRQANVSLARAQQSLTQSYERHFRVKIQLAMKHFGIPQQLRYEGEDGAYKQEWWTGVDFAQVTDIAIMPGTGTMMPPQDKIQMLQQLVAAQFTTPAAAAKAARPAFAASLGMPEDPHQQRVERQVGTWLKGPPSPEWVPQAQAYNQAKQVADQQNQQAQAMYQQGVQQLTAQHNQETAQHTADAGVSGAMKQPHGVPVPQAPMLPPPPQPVPPMDPQTGQPMAPPWTPFQPLPWDNEPMIAALRQERLSDLGATVRYTAQPPEWQAMVVNEYNAMRSAVAASQAPPAMPKGVSVVAKTTAADVGQAEQSATHPGQQKAA